MTLAPQVRAELERRGIASVRELLWNATGPGQGSSVSLHAPNIPNPLRGEVEEWLREKEAAVETLATSRHQEQIAVGEDAVRWARWAFWAALVSAVIAGIALLGH